GEADYRYLTDPDLPEIDVAPTWTEELRARMAELPAAKETRFAALGVRQADAHQIAYDVATASTFEEAARAYGGDPQLHANWLVMELAGVPNHRGAVLGSSALRANDLAAPLQLVDDGVISGAIAKELLPDVVDGADPPERVEALGL